VTIEHHDVEFTRDGRTFDETQVAGLLGSLDGVTDLLVAAHGWNNDRNEASQLYASLSESLAQVLAGNTVTGLDGRKIAMLRVYWPSKRFAESDLIPGGGAASATEANDDALLRILEDLKSNPDRLGVAGTDLVREANLSSAQALVPSLEADPAARREYVLRIRSILDASEADTDDGSDEFFARDPEELFQELSNPVPAPPAARSGGALSVGTGQAAGLADMLGGVVAAARRIANYSTYYEMKQRAGLVGRAGLAPLLRRIRDRQPALRLHLVGHSFGGRLVVAAANGLPAATPSVTLVLLQAAFSHNGFGENYDSDGHDGAFRAVLGELRVSGPVLITHTKNDRAVGVAYPLASRLSRDPASALGDRNDPYGGMGRNGAQHTPEAVGLDGDLLDHGIAYPPLQAGKVYNLKADDFISDHGDVTGLQVASAILHAVATA
jgi:hypothetical protein